MRNEVLVFSLDKKFKELEKEVEVIGKKILEILKKNSVSVEIYLADARKMRFLNKKFRGKDKAASILSFEEPRNFVLPASKTKKIGEIYLNVSCSMYHAARERLLAHGLLHLLGYKHGNKNDRLIMEKREKYVHNRLRPRFISN